MEIDLPAENPTGLSTAILNLENVETFTKDTFKELFDENDSVKFVIGFTQDSTGKWRSTFFDAGYFDSYEVSQYGLIKDPDTRLPIQYIVRITVIKEK